MCIVVKGLSIVGVFEGANACIVVVIYCSGRSQSFILISRSIVKVMML